VGVKLGLSHRLRGFEGRVMRKIFGPKRGEEHKFDNICPHITEFKNKCMYSSVLPICLHVMDTDKLTIFPKYGQF
jgi:hypothetical protein